jgi:hypothetical protein
VRALKSNNLVESKPCEVLSAVPQLFKYEVYFNLTEDALFLSDSWNDVVFHLQEDDKFVALALDWYCDQLDGAFNEADFDDYMNDHGKAIATELGYTIRSAK